MASRFVPSEQVALIRGRLTHPVIDADGHLAEFMPMVIDCLREVADNAVAERFVQFRRSPFTSGQGYLPTRVFFGSPPTLDRMTVMLPQLLYQRLEEIGLDFSLLYPTSGLSVLSNPDDELRQAAARALNTYYARVFAEYRDRLEPVAVIPTFTPAEAVAELDYAVGTLGLKAVVMSGTVPRTVRPDGSATSWVDTLGHDSLFDYGPLWARCVELGVAPAFHGIGYGWGSRVSPKNYVYNHLGNFGAAQEAACRSLIMGGVPKRHPEIRLCFLEGGVAWAAQLYADLLGHFDKRNKDAVQLFNPARFDVSMAGELFSEFAEGSLRGFLDRVEQGAMPLGDRGEALYGTDDFAESGISCPEDIVDIFTRQLGFGCEADDPLNAIAFNGRLLPRGVRLNAMFASDIGHWDVPDMREVLLEAWELVAHGHLSEEDFSQFACGNVVRMLTDLNPRFFEGTAVADAVRPYIGTIV
jgi:predicted TIM-barrel fold metal-dependent hydrolase